MNPLNPVILCVDDEEANLKLLEKLLVPRGYVVVSAISGKDALLEIRSQVIDLVLLDIIMPGMDGFEVCRQIKEDQKLRNIPVIMITASSVKQDRVRGIEAGAEEFLSKPFDLAEVLARIKMLLKMKGLDDERKRAESQREVALAALQKSHDELDRRVRERTAELAQANEMLQAYITERKRVEEILRISEGRYRMAQSMGHVGNWEYNLQTTKFWGSDEAKRIYEFDPEALDFSTDEVENCIPERERVHRALLDLIERDKPYNLEFEIHPKNSLKPRIISSIAELKRDEPGNPLLVTGVIQDITGRKQAEKALRVSEENYRNLFENAGEAIYVVQDGKLEFFNPVATMMIGYSAEELMSRSFIEFIHPDDRDMVIDRHARRMKGEEFPHIYPFRLIHRDGHVTWVELNAVLIKWRGKPATLNFLSDITDRKQAEKHLKETLESLRKAFHGTIQVIASAVESRDPYTAGHQIRAADLARAIATELGLPPEKIESTWMAGSIHDVGKLSIPAELLSKPTKLAPLELLMIKEHAQKGYEMLKDVESPWPLAQIVYQHHERLDGSGYPRNLKGEEILIEARILMVADVVEAMASHRPYRPGLGINAALSEIAKNRGIFYDEAVADACLRLFREKGFKLEKT